MKEATVTKSIEERNGREYTVNGWDCPDCDALNECKDDFLWRNSRYEYRDLKTCKECGIEVQLIKTRL